jgi:hypothetical protein
MKLMTRVCCLLLAAVAAIAQYKAQPAGDPPSEAAPAIVSALNKAGTKVVADNGSTWVEIWLRSSAPSGPKSSEPSVSLPTIPSGVLLGVLRFPAKANDRRGQTIAPGVYTLRYGNYPVNGDHQGAAPQRDFLVLAPAAIDKAADTISDFNAMIEQSRKASGTPHPAVLSFWKSDADTKPGLEKQGESDWVLNTKIGDLSVSIIVAGKAGE